LNSPRVLGSRSRQVYILKTAPGQNRDLDETLRASQAGDQNRILLPSRTLADAFVQVNRSIAVEDNADIPAKPDNFIVDAPPKKESEMPYMEFVRTY